MEVLEIEADTGVSFSFELLWEIDGEPVNLEGWTGHMDIRASTLPDSPRLAAAQVVMSERPGYIEISISAEDMIGIDPGLYWFDVILMSPGAISYKKLEGRMRVGGTVTRYWEDNS